MSFSTMGLSDIAKLLEEGVQDLPPTAPTMINVPDDVLCLALTYIGIGEICSTAQVNGRWYDALNNAEAEVILNILQRYGPVLRSFSDYDTARREDRVRDGASMDNEHETRKEFLRRAHTVMKVSSQGNSMVPLLGNQTPFALPTIPPPSLFASSSSDAIDVEYRTGDAQRGSSVVSPYLNDGSFYCSIRLTHKFLSNPSISLRFSNGKNATFLRTNFVLKRFANGIVFSTYRADIKEFEWHPFEDCQHIHIVTRGALRYHHRLRDPDQAEIVLNFRFDLRYGPDLFIKLSQLELSRILEAMFD